MKILILSNKPPYPPKDGGAIAVFGLAKAMASLGHRVVILAMNTSKHRVRTDEYKIHKNLELHYVDIELKISPVKALINLIFSSYPYNAERFVSSEYVKALKQILNHESFDVVQTEGPYLSYVLPYIKSQVGLTSLRAHNIEFEIWQRTADNCGNILKKIYLKSLAKRIKKLELSLFHLYDVWIPITVRDEKEFKKLGLCKRSMVIPVGIEPDSFGYKNEAQFPSLCYIGALDWMPNQEGLLWFFDNIWKRLQQKHPDLQLHVAGRNAPASIKTRLLKEKNVLFHGEVPDTKIFLNQFAVQIVPLLAGSGMRVKIIEGMALGKAIVTTEIGSEGIDVIDGENILIAHNPEEFEFKIHELLGNRNLFLKISENARSFVEKNYNNIAIARSLEGFYEEQMIKA